MAGEDGVFTLDHNRERRSQEGPNLMTKILEQHLLLGTVSSDTDITSHNTGI
jgi:hypothetical protein